MATTEGGREIQFESVTFVLPSTLYVRPGIVLQVITDAPSTTCIDKMVGADAGFVTVTVNELVALSDGWPLSVTTVVKVFPPKPCPLGAVQVITPLLSICPPEGALNKV